MYPQQLTFPWNKSLPRESVVYSARSASRVVSAIERMPVKAKAVARFEVEAIVARYQPQRANRDWPEILVMLRRA